MCLLSPSAQEYYVTPSPPPNPACPTDKHCHTLSYYANNTSTIFGEGKNISLLFLDGYHETDHLYIYQVQCLILAGADGSFNNGTPQAVVKMRNFTLSNGTLLRLENIALTESHMDVRSVERFVSRNVLYEITSLEIVSYSTKAVNIENSKFTGGDFFWHIKRQSSFPNRGDYKYSWHRNCFYYRNKWRFN